MPNVLIQTQTSTKTFAYSFWDGQRLRSSRECPLSIDTETSLITDEREIPRLALAVAADGRSHVVIHTDRLADFLLTHRDAQFVGHNVQYDFWVIDRHLKQRGAEQARQVLWNVCDEGRLFDTQVLDMLLQLATGKFRHAEGARGGEAKVYPGSLADVAADYTALRADKSDPYRLRFGQLVGLPFEAWAGVEAGFFEYAVRDAAVTWRLYPALANAAYGLMFENGYNPRAGRYDIRPDALAKFGYLSEIVQVKASVVLAYLLRRGVRVDVEKARVLESTYRAEMAESIAAIERDHREVLAYGKDGQLRLTPKGKTPSLPTKKLEAKLLKVAEEIRAGGHDIVVPVSDGKKKGVSHSVKAWAEYAGLHPFVKHWTRMSKLSKLLSFFGSLTAPVLHGEYGLLTRTGRTSCSRPRSEALPGLNLQQMPRLPEFRALFVAAPGTKLFTGDFAAVELRTLAAVCMARYGRSRLGEVIAGGTDPHAFTAAAVLGMPLNDFMALKGTDPNRFKAARQAAKAVNFGVPGGLGADTLVAYAKANYGVTLSHDDAAAFRQKLVTEVYPELNEADGYLADDGVAALAKNLGVKEREAWELFDPSGRRNSIAARGVAKVIRGTSTASTHYQARVWDGLQRLAATVTGLDPLVAESIGRHQGSQRLHDVLYRKSAVTLTGRVRAGVGYTEGRNTPFQSLAADGAKLALWDLLYAGFDVVAFIHDEVLVELKAHEAEGKAKEVERIMVRAMEEVMGQGIPAACEYGVADQWAKA